MQVCKYMHELAYTTEFSGTVKGKQVQSKVINVGGESFIGTASGKAIWIKVKGARGKTFNFALPVSQMYNVKKVQNKGKPHIVFEMTKGMYRSATFGKKDKDGKRIFKRKASCYNCENYRAKSYVGNSGSSGKSI